MSDGITVAVADSETGLRTVAHGPKRILAQRGMGLRLGGVLGPGWTGCGWGGFIAPGGTGPGWSGIWLVGKVFWLVGKVFWLSG